MKSIATSTIAVLAEKPSVARDIARVLGADKRGEGYLQGNGYVVTWAIGHLVSLAQPHEINPEWRQWRFDLLPILPGHWPLVVYERTKDQFEVVRKILTSPRVSRIVCATDAGREGELIFRYIYEMTESKKPVSRLWISSLTPDAIRKGFDKLNPGSEYDRLADAASGRSRADWLVGMNLSRAYSIVYGQELSVGRVQTPTLAMVVDRELTLRRFVSEDYIEVVATFERRERPTNGSVRKQSLASTKTPKRTSLDCPPMARKPTASFFGLVRGKPSSSHSPLRRNGCNHRCCTTLQSCSGMPIVCTALALKTLSTLHRLSMSGTN